jgi:hypothetical protein
MANVPIDLFKINPDYNKIIPENAGLVISGIVRGRIDKQGNIIILEEDLRYIRIIDLNETKTNSNGRRSTSDSTGS